MFAARGGGVPSRRPHPHCTLFPPHEQLLVVVVGGAMVVLAGVVAIITVVVVLAPPSCHPHPCCTPFPLHEQLLVAVVGGAMVVLVEVVAIIIIVIVPAPPSHCTPFPPHEQLLVAGVEGAVLVVVLRHRWHQHQCVSSSSSSFSLPATRNLYPPPGVPSPCGMTQNPCRSAWILSREWNSLSLVFWPLWSTWIASGSAWNTRTVLGQF
jgi:hypothetical protein